jgi:pimeloyl-ACP methyl ester carboxylesterase
VCGEFYAAAEAATNDFVIDHGPKGRENTKRTLSAFLDAQIKCFNQSQFIFPFPEMNTTLHFLEHAGTHALVNDINMFRMAFGANKISMYGSSYGTAVLGLFATVFPDYLDKFVADSTMPAVADARAFARDKAAIVVEVEDIQIATCERVGKAGGCELMDSRYITATRDLALLLKEVHVWGPAR